jgi:hypothetical protein
MHMRIAILICIPCVIEDMYGIETIAKLNEQKVIQSTLRSCGPCMVLSNAVRSEAP